MPTDIIWTNTTVKLGDLQPWQRNPRKSSKKQAQKMLESWDKFGQVQTVAVSPSLQVLDGHQRLGALLTVHGKGYEVDARQASRELSEEEREQLVITLHTGAVGSWDWDSLANWDATSLKEWGFDADALKTWNTDAAALSLLLESEKAEALEDPGAQIDRAEELREKWGVSLGQMWQCGEHRLICGDCTDAAVVARVMGGEKANGAFTSPPYAEQRAHVYESYSADEYVEWWGLVQEQTKNALAPDANFFINIKAHSKEYKRSLYVMDMVCAMVRRWGWDYIDEFSWLRVGIPGDPKIMGKFKNQFEPIYQFATGNYPFYPNNVMHESNDAILDANYQPGFGRNFQGQGGDHFGERKQGKGMAYPGNVIKTGQTEALGHSASFPVDLPAFFIAAYSQAGEIWYEPFSGSGSTLMAAEMTGRKCRAVEISPAYVAVSLERFFQMTGIEPELIDNG